MTVCIIVLVVVNLILDATRKMKGFELEIEGRQINGAIEGGVVFITLIGCGDEIDLTFVGTTLNERLMFYKMKLQEGDSFDVTAIDVSTSSVAVDIQDKSDDELLKMYHQLEKELKHKKII